jgi:hypothetical protein
VPAGVLEEAAAQGRVQAHCGCTPAAAAAVIMQLSLSSRLASSVGISAFSGILLLKQLLKLEQAQSVIAFANVNATDLPGKPEASHARGSRGTCTPSALAKQNWVNAAQAAFVAQPVQNDCERQTQLLQKAHAAVLLSQQFTVNLTYACIHGMCAALTAAELINFPSAASLRDNRCACDTTTLTRVTCGL